MKKFISLTAIFIFASLPGMLLFSVSTGFRTGDMQCYRSEVPEKEVRITNKRTGRISHYRVNNMEVCRGILTLSEGRKVVFKDSVDNCDLVVLRVYGGR